MRFARHSRVLCHVEGEGGGDGRNRVEGGGESAKRGQGAEKGLGLNEGGGGGGGAMGKGKHDRRDRGGEVSLEDANKNKQKDGALAGPPPAAWRLRVPIVTASDFLVVPPLARPNGARIDDHWTGRVSGHIAPRRVFLYPGNGRGVKKVGESAGGTAAAVRLVVAVPPFLRSQRGARHPEKTFKNDSINQMAAAAGAAAAMSPSVRCLAEAQGALVTGECRSPRRGSSESPGFCRANAHSSQRCLQVSDGRIRAQWWSVPC